MRSNYKGVSSSDYLRYYQAGGGELFFRGGRQKGRGLGSFFSSLYRHVKPLFRPVLKALGRKAVSTGIKVFNDVSSGQNVKEAIKSRLKQGSADLLEQASQKLRGRGGRRRKGIKRTTARLRAQSLRGGRRIKRRKPRSRKDIFGV